MPLTPIFHFFWPYKASEGGSIGGFTIYESQTRDPLLSSFPFFLEKSKQKSGKSAKKYSENILNALWHDTTAIKSPTRETTKTQSKKAFSDASASQKCQISSRRRWFYSLVCLIISNFSFDFFSQLLAGEGKEKEINFTCFYDTI
jgi:hypothetical protein